MEINTFIEKFADQFDETDVELFNADTKYKELEEWSSLSALTIIAMIDESYDVAIKGEDIRSSTTISDLFEIVKTRI